ncbi:MAG: ribosome maturation factor RimM [Treponema sp.]|nr:ribosome maturation factor RimM [Treponema sp.]
MTEKFIIGTIGAPFGVKGFVKVRSASGETEHLLKLKSVTVIKDGKEQHLQIAESSGAANGIGALSAVLIRFKGIDNPESARTLSGAQLLASRDQASPLGEGEFYIEDLKGLPVLSEDGGLIGHVTDIIEGGGGELAEIKMLTSDVKCLVPFRKDFFKEIAPEKGRLLLNSWGMDLIPCRQYTAE